MIRRTEPTTSNRRLARGRDFRARPPNVFLGESLSPGRVPMAIWRLVIRVLHRRPCNARMTSHDGDPMNTSVETM